MTQCLEGLRPDRLFPIEKPKSHNCTVDGLISVRMFGSQDKTWGQISSTFPLTHRMTLSFLPGPNIRKDSGIIDSNTTMHCTIAITHAVCLDERFRFDYDKFPRCSFSQTHLNGRVGQKV